jgi:MFS family permease
MGMWGWGFLVSPALSGMLSEPVKQYPKSQFVDLFGGVFQSFPFLLPNLASLLFCTVAIVSVKAFVPETLPDEKLRDPRYIFSDFSFWFIYKLRSVIPRTKRNPAVSKLIPDYGAIERKETATESIVQADDDCFDDDSVREARMNHTESCSMLSTASPRQSLSKKLTTQPGRSYSDSREATLSSLWSKRDTRNHLIIYWFFSFVTVAVDEAFPLFCISRKAGLGLSEATIGKILSGSGLIFAVSQYFVYSSIVDKFGLQRSIQIGAMFSGPLILFLPVSLYLNTEIAEDSLSWGAFAYLSILLALYRVFALVFFSSITIATNRTVVPSHRGSMNGLSMLGGSFAKGLGPIFAGFLVAFSVSSGVFTPHVGAIVVFAVIGLLGGATVVMTFLLLGEEGIKKESEPKG